MHPEFKDRFLEKLAEKTFDFLEAGGKPHGSMTVLMEVAAAEAYEEGKEPEICIDPKCGSPSGYCGRCLRNESKAQYKATEEPKRCDCGICSWCRDGKQLAIFKEALKEELRKRLLYWVNRWRVCYMVADLGSHHGAGWIVDVEDLMKQINIDALGDDWNAKIKETLLKT